MDEPFSALDPLIRAKLQDELLDLQEKVHKTILFVSHDLDEALKLGDRISILEGGRMIQTGTAEDIVLRPATPYVADFVAHVNPLNVMTGETVMRPIETLEERDGRVLLDERGRCRLTAGGGLDTLTLDNAPHAPTHLADADSYLKAPWGVVVCPAHVPLRTLIHVLGESDQPVLLTQGDRLVGVCGGRDVLKALELKERHLLPPLTASRADFLLSRISIT